MNLYTYVGTAEGQSFRILLAEDGSSGSCRLTAATDGSDEVPPLDLAKDDGLVLLVRGIRRDDWIYSAVVVERGDALISLIAQAALGDRVRYPAG